MAKKFDSYNDNMGLCEALDVARHCTKFFREEHMRGVRRFAGNRYSENAEPKKTFLNLIGLYVNIVLRSLISNNPRVMLSTFDRTQKSTVSAAETWMNQQLVKQDFADKLRRIALDALFSIGIAKTTIATVEDAGQYGWGVKAGQPMLSRVNLDDFIYDHMARGFDECRFIGHRYCVPLELARENPHFDKKARELLVASEEDEYNNDGDERIAQIGRGVHGNDRNLYDPYVELWEIYLPRHRCIKTFTEDNLSGPTSSWNGSKPIPLRTQKWIGPETGPFRMLAYGIVPGQIFPKGPIQDLIDLDIEANEAYRKLMRQAKRLKINTLVQSHNIEDGEALGNANDGDRVPVADPKSVQELVRGGPHPGLHQWMKDIVERFMTMGGNLLTMGGLAPQAGTLGQEELLAQQSNGQVASMQDITVTFVSKVCSNMLWYWWNDPRLVMKASIDDPRLPDVDYVRTVHPWDGPPEAMKRIGKMPELKIDPYSMRNRTPQARIKDLTQILTQIYVPMAGLAQKQGVDFDFQAFMAMMAKYLDEPEILSLFKLAEVQKEVGNSPEGESGPAPASTTREYVRRSIGGESRQAKEMEANNALSMSAAESNGQSSGQY